MHYIYTIQVTYFPSHQVLTLLHLKVTYYIILGEDAIVADADTIVQSIVYSPRTVENLIKRVDEIVIDNELITTGAIEDHFSPVSTVLQQVLSCVFQI